METTEPVDYFDWTADEEEFDNYEIEETLDPLWYEFIVNDEVDSWALVMTYDENFSEFYLWT